MNCFCSPPGSSVHGILQARILQCHFLLQGIFPTQGSNLCLLCLLLWQADFFFFLNHWGSPPKLIVMYKLRASGLICPQLVAPLSTLTSIMSILGLPNFYHLCKLSHPLASPLHILSSPSSWDKDNIHTIMTTPQQPTGLRNSAQLASAK